MSPAIPRVTHSVPLSLVALMPLAWLVPNHYSPWLSAWLEAPALASALAAAVLLKGKSAMPRSWALVFTLVAVSVVLQLAVGRLRFAGDAVMVLLFVMGAMAALKVGQQLPLTPVSRLGSGVEIFALAMLLSAMVSVAIALAQWTGAWGPSLWRADLPWKERPFANVAQPNHFATICFLGLCAIAVLFESKVLRMTAALAAAAFLLFGMVMTVSRTGWLQLALLAAAFAFLHRKTGSRITWAALLGLGLAFVAAVTSWSLLNEWLLLQPGRTALQDIDGSGRLPLWWALLDAIRQAPWLGFGWLQLASAQLSVASTHTGIGQHFDYAHNLLLDLWVWMGLPLGLAVSGLIVLWFARAVRGVTDARTLWLVVALGGFGVHAMLEYPHAYAYFLAPVFVLIGAVQAGLPPSAATQMRGTWWIRLVSAAGLLLLFMIAREYLTVEENYRSFRFETARVGHLSVATTGPDGPLLTQLNEFLRYARNEAKPGLSGEELLRMKRVAERYPYPPALFRYALALALNGKPQEAQAVVIALCGMHAKRHCREGRVAWAQGAVRYPALTAVRWPEPP